MVRSSRRRPSLPESSVPFPGKKDSKSLTRKLEKKQKFYAKIKDAVVSLGAKKAITKKKRLRSRQKKLKAYDLSALSEYLPELDAPQQPSTANNPKLNCKNRQKLVERESRQLRHVLNNPFFQMDPLSAIRQHLLATQPPETNKDKDSGKNRKNKRNGKKKPSSGSHMMVS